MKRFFRTIGGKLSLFVCCITCLCLLAGSAALAVFLLEESQFYTAPEAEIYTDYLSRPLRGYGYSLLADILHQHAPEADWGNAVWQVQDASGTVIRRSRSAGGVENWEFRFDTVTSRRTKKDSNCATCGLARNGSRGWRSTPSPSL